MKPTKQQQKKFLEDLIDLGIVKIKDNEKTIATAVDTIIVIAAVFIIMGAIIL